MRPLCPLCGGLSGAPFLRKIDPMGLRVMRTRMCDSGHIFTTHEVTATLLADSRESAAAIRNIMRRVGRWNRDAAIRADKRHPREIAAAHNLTEARVRQIRAQPRPETLNEDSSDNPQE